MGARRWKTGRLSLGAISIAFLLAIVSSCSSGLSFGQHPTPEVQFMFAVGQLSTRTISVGDLPFAYDWKGRVFKVGADLVTYKSGLIAQIGTARIQYNERGELVQVGELPVIYSAEAGLIALGDAAIAYNEVGHILRIGSIPLQYDAQHRVSQIDHMPVRYGPALAPS